MARYPFHSSLCEGLVFQSRASRLGIVVPFLLAMALSSCGGGGGGGGGGDASPNIFALTVSSAGTGTGTVTSAPAGINCGSDCSENYASGTQVTLTAAAGTSSSFAGWGGACSGTGSCVVSMDAAKAVTATFDLQKPLAPVLSLTPQSVKIFHFTWADVTGETSYNLQEDPDGVSGFSTVATLAADASSHDLVVFLPQRVNARYLVQACNAAGCSDSATVTVSGTLTQAMGYFKASNTDSGDNFGDAVSLSGDGTTLAIGASSEDSAATGINGNEADNSVQNSGAVYVFVRGNGGWTQEAYIKASNPDASDGFGGAVALSADGNTLAVGAPFEDSNATGIDGNQADNSVFQAGAAYVFVRSGTAWSQQAYVKASNTGANDRFGNAISLSSDGNTLAVGAFNEDSNATGVNGNETDNSATAAGAVYVFIRSGTAWSQQAYVKASNSEALDLFGTRLSLSGDGDTLAVGATAEDSNATGINGNQADNSASRAGAVYLFTRSGTTWSQQAYVKASNAEANDVFGISVALSEDGNTLAVGATGESSNATGINGNETDNSLSQVGAVYLFSRSGTTWSQQAYVKASNAGNADNFGRSLSLSDTGDDLVVGAVFESSASTGVGGDETDNSTSNAGAAYLFQRNAGIWSQVTYIKASNTDFGDNFAEALSLSGNADVLAVGAPFEDSSATGIGGNASDNTASSAGAVYLY